MRGFPLLNAVLVVAVFVVASAAGPLRRLAEPDGRLLQPAHVDVAAPDAPSVGGERPLAMRLYATHHWDELKVELLGRTVVELASPPAGGRSEVELVSAPVTVPPEGIELWVEAQFPEPPGGGAVALGIEVAPEGMPPLTKTLWSDGGTVADSVEFVWE